MMQYFGPIIMPYHKVWHKTEKTVQPHLKAYWCEANSKTGYERRTDYPFGIPALRNDRKQHTPIKQTQQVP